MMKMPYSLDGNQIDYSKVVLNTARDVGSIKKMLVDVESMIDEDEIYHTLVESIIYEKAASYELEYTLHYDYGNVGCYFKQYSMGRDLLDNLQKLGTSIIDQLRELGLYRDGVINYRYGYLAGMDLVLYSNEYYVNHIVIPNIKESV